MKYIAYYSEFDSDDKTSLLNNISSNEIEGKDRVLYYLKHGIDDGVQCHGIFDYVKNEPQFDTVHLFTDGEYYWSSEEIYHFEKYNMKLSDDFINKVMKHKQNTFGADVG